jgi:hypothetical protein
MHVLRYPVPDMQLARKSVMLTLSIMYLPRGLSMAVFYEGFGLDTYGQPVRT